MGIDAARATAVSEVRFWVRIMKELQDAVDSRPVLGNAILADIRQAEAALIEFKRHLIRLSVQCELPGGVLYPLLLAHVLR